MRTGKVSDKRFQVKKSLYIWLYQWTCAVWIENKDLEFIWSVYCRYLSRLLKCSIWCEFLKSNKLHLYKYIVQIFKFDEINFVYYSRTIVEVLFAFDLPAFKNESGMSTLHFDKKIFSIQKLSAYLFLSIIFYITQRLCNKVLLTGKLPKSYFSLNRRIQNFYPFLLTPRV